MNISVYAPRNSTYNKGCSRSKRGNSWYNWYNWNERGNLITTLRENCNNKEEWNESQNRIPTEILKQSINLVESTRKLTNQNDKNPRFYTHKTNKKYYEKHNIETPTDFSNYILNLCIKYLEEIDTKNIDSIKNKLTIIKELQNQLYLHKSIIKEYEAIDEDTIELLSIVFLKINNLSEICKQLISL